MIRGNIERGNGTEERKGSEGREVEDDDEDEHDYECAWLAGSF
jgi:hypothetical protein